MEPTLSNSPAFSGIVIGLAIIFGLLLIGMFGSPKKQKPEEYRLTPGDKEIVFTGALLSYVIGDEPNQVWRLYKTVGANYICYRSSRTPELTNDDEFQVCTTPQEVKAYFGNSKLANQLYDESGIDDLKSLPKETIVVA